MIKNIGPQMSNLQAWPAVPTEADVACRVVVPIDAERYLAGNVASSGQETTKYRQSVFQTILHMDDDAKEEDGHRKRWVQTAQADLFFGGWICVNAVILGVETDFRTLANEEDVIWTFLDSTFNVVFLIELCLRIYAERRKWIRDVWNIFDFILVVVGVFDTWMLPATGLNSDMRFVTLMRLFRLFRLIRVLRVLRLLRFLKELMLLIQGITSAMRAMVWGLLLLAITIFICALLLTRLVGKACCDSDDTFRDQLYRNLFGTLSRSSFTLFQFTMEFQPDICRDTWDYGPWLTIFFLAYTMFTNVTLLNTVASVIVENILSISAQNNEEEKANQKSEMAEENSWSLSNLFDALDGDSDGLIDKAEMSTTNPAVSKLLSMSGVSFDHLLNLFNIMDVDSNGLVDRDEFQTAMSRGKHPLQAVDVLRVQCQVDALRSKMKKTFEDVSTQNSSILEVLQRVEAGQAALEEKLVRGQQPDPKDLDSMSISFVKKLAVPTPAKEDTKDDTNSVATPPKEDQTSVPCALVSLASAASTGIPVGGAKEELLV